MDFKEKIFPKTFTFPSGKWRINSNSMTTKFTSPTLLDLNFFVPCIHAVFHIKWHFLDEQLAGESKKVKKIAV